MERRCALLRHDRQEADVGRWVEAVSGGGNSCGRWNRCAPATKDVAKEVSPRIIALSTTAEWPVARNRGDNGQQRAQACAAPKHCAVQSAAGATRGDGRSRKLPQSCNGSTAGGTSAFLFAPSFLVLTFIARTTCTQNILRHSICATLRVRLSLLSSTPHRSLHSIPLLSHNPTLTR